MRFTQVALVLAASTSVLAAPIHEKRWFPGSLFQAASSDVTSVIDYIKRHPWPLAGPIPSVQVIAGQCDLSQAQLPQAPTPLPPVSPGLTLYHVALGRGTQNYTCDTSNATAPPVAIGAVATLFNVSCMAATNSAFLSTMPDTALATPAPAAGSNNNDPLYTFLSGHHYFTDNTTPYFNLDTAQQDYGQSPFKKLNATAAPTTANKGQAGEAYGAVAWLKLASKLPAGAAPFEEVYRVNTAGGNPPATCAGQQAAFQIQYSAEYWFYAK